MSTVFIAVQCFQCSTMQVKQKKKSSNKWICVVCNEKQSMRKVFAQGFMARDVRKFVQTFNMSRSQFEHHHHTNETLDQVPEQTDNQPQSSNDRKRRPDWSEYIDPNDIHDTEEEDKKEEDLFGPRIVRELPHKELFKKPTADSSGFGTTQDSGRGFRPVFHQGNSNKGKEPLNFEPTTADWASKKFDYTSQAEEGIFAVEGLQQSFSDRDSSWRTYTKQQVEDGFAGSKGCHSTTARASSTKSGAYFLQDNNKVTEGKGPQKSQLGTMKGASKWDRYIAEDDDEGDYHQNIGREFADYKRKWDDFASDTKPYDRSVEEEIHPDFL